MTYGPYHRLESSTQTVADAAQIEQSGELWGTGYTGSLIPAVLAYTGPLPAGKRGIEFSTDIKPNAQTPPGRAEWSATNQGVKTRSVSGIDFAVIKIRVAKNTQK